MKIIQKIEIRYFRSIYSVDIKNLTDLTILVGGNDSGKSNILKALNLFFNNETELNDWFDFEQDLSHFRVEEVRKAKGKAQIWIRITFNNFLGWKSLPEKFSIKKSWNRYDEDPKLTIPTNGNGISPTTISKFLNKIEFHYIPAVRSRKVFSHYLELLHDCLINDKKVGITNASKKLTESINHSTVEMAAKVEKLTGMKTSIQPPDNLSNVFSVLDFSTDFGHVSVPLTKRGDGIQARHIPFVLDFISNKNGQYNIWGYEEPETALELAKAFDLAQHFSDTFSKNNQVFLTSHSPAFYGLTGDNIRKCHIKQTEVDNGFHQTVVKEIKNISETDSDLGLAALITDRVGDLYRQLEFESELNKKLQGKVDEYETPIMYVEGISDKKIIEEAYKKLRPDSNLPISIIVCNNADTVCSHTKSVLNMSIPERVKIISLLDRDDEGIRKAKSYKLISSQSLSPGFTYQDISKDKNGSVFVIFLPFHSDAKAAEEAISNARPEVKYMVPVTIETVFPSEIINQAIAENKLSFDNISNKVTQAGSTYEIDFTSAIEGSFPENLRYFSKKVSDSHKRDFSKWIKSLPETAFSNFETLLEQIDQILTES